MLWAELLYKILPNRTTVTYKMLRAELLLLTRCCGQNYCYLQDALGRTTVQDTSEHNYCYLQDAVGRTNVTYKILWAELLLLTRCCGQNYCYLEEMRGQNCCYLQDAAEQNYGYIYFQEGLSAEIVIQCSNETGNFLVKLCGYTALQIYPQFDSTEGYISRVQEMNQLDSFRMSGSSFSVAQQCDSVRVLFISTRSIFLNCVFSCTIYKEIASE